MLLQTLWFVCRANTFLLFVIDLQQINIVNIANDVLKKD